MSKAPIIFVRHGESQSNLFLHNNDPDASRKIQQIGDPELTELGTLQATCTAKHLCETLMHMELPKVRVLISPFARAQQTAKPFLEMYCSKIKESQVIPDLLEYTSPEKNLCQQHLETGLKHDKSWDEFKERIIKFEKIVGGEPDCPIIVFGHSMFISCLVSYISSQKNLFSRKESNVFPISKLFINNICVG